MIYTPTNFRRVSILLLLIFLMSARGVLSANDNSPDSIDASDENANKIVTMVIDAYESGDINHSEFLALKALDNSSELSKLDQFTLYKILAFCAVANDDEAGGIRRFKSALSLKPNIVADPITWSPKIRRVFDQARSEFKTEEIMVRARHSAVEADICRSASMKSLYLPGSGQIYKGYKGKGLILGALFWGTAATFIYSRAALPTAKDQYINATIQADVVQRWDEYHNIYRLNRVSGMLTATIYAYIFFDALLMKPKPEKVEERY